jgi:AAA ATPase domain
MGSTGGLTVGLMGLSLGLGIGLGSAEGTSKDSKKRRITIMMGWSFWRIALYITINVAFIYFISLIGGAVGGWLESQGIDPKNGIIFGAVIGIASGIVIGGLIGISWGSGLGSEKSEAWSVKRGITKNIIGRVSRIIGQIIGIPLGIFIWGLVGSIFGCILGGLIGGISRIILGNNVKTFVAFVALVNGSNGPNPSNIPGSTATGIGLSIFVSAVLFTLLTLWLDIILLKNSFKKAGEYIREGSDETLKKMIILIIQEMKKEQAEAIGQSTIIGLAGGILGGILTYVGSNLVIGIDVVGGVMIAITLFTGYYLGYLRLFLYPLSNFSMNWAYQASSENPHKVSYYLHRSSLHWNKRLPLDSDKVLKLLAITVQQSTEQALQEINFILTERPELLPADELTQLLLIIAEQDTEQALQEINFILTERPELLPADELTQLLLIIAEQDTELALQEINFILTEKPENCDAAQTAWLAITIGKLKTCENLHDIAQVSQELSAILQEKSVLIPPDWITTFAILEYASREAAHYCSPLPLSWRGRREALKEMITYLERTNPLAAIANNWRETFQMQEVVDKWREIAQVELEKLEKIEINWIENPYTPGPALELSNSLFVGRRDLVRQLEDALGRGRSRPTFFLNGERRMGKSSTLKQLPAMLAAHYLPIFYDLQARGISSSIVAFLRTIAREIYEMTVSRGIQVKQLEEGRLKEAGQRNEAAVYYVFDEWLRDVEDKLEQENRTLLLTFDEFEKLGEVGQAKYLDLNLLLDWFRSVVQNHPRLALLFSGVSNLEEMSIGTGINWAGYFVNVRTLKVGFLESEEAFKLITEPVPNFPGEKIFGEEVIKEIMRVTGYHPFLVQAVCETLVNNLNADKRDRTEMQDMSVAVNQVLANWWDTYFRDLWIRTDQNQRVCLIAIKRLGAGNLEEITQQSNLGEKIVRDTIQTLLKRDLVTFENDNYRISTPIFTEWVKRSS